MLGFGWMSFCPAAQLLNFLPFSLAGNDVSGGETDFWAQLMIVDAAIIPPLILWALWATCKSYQLHVEVHRFCKHDQIDNADQQRENVRTPLDFQLHIALPFKC